MELLKLLGNRNCFGLGLKNAALILLLVFGAATAAQMLEPLAAIPSGQRDKLYKRLDGYVVAYKRADWSKLYGLVSTVGRGSADEQAFVAVMRANHAGDFEQFPHLQEFLASRSRKNGDGYDILGCGAGEREGEAYRGILEIHAVREADDWFFTGWALRDTSDDACKQLSDPAWVPGEPIVWDKPMAEIAQGY